MNEKDDMSTTGMATLIEEFTPQHPGLLRSAKWRALMIIPRCAGTECPRRGRFWPLQFAKTSGVLFESRWYCSVACLQGLLAVRLHDLLSGFTPEPSRTYRVPIGLLLVNRGTISHEQLREALRRQRAAGHGRLGEWLRRMDVIVDQQLTTALGQQWGCPVFPLERQPFHSANGNLVPLALFESACAVPAHVSPDARTVHLAFGDRLDFTTLYAVERMLDCRTIACVATESSVRKLLYELRRANPILDPAFDTVHDPAEMARIVCSYAVELRATRVTAARAADYIWVRFHRKDAARDLLFRILPEASHRTPVPPAGAKAIPTSVDRRKDGVSDAATPL
jgi:hypothetical protein